MPESWLQFLFYIYETFDKLSFYLKLNSGKINEKTKISNSKQIGRIYLVDAERV